MSKITKVHAREVLDSRGNPTGEVEVTTEKKKKDDQGTYMYSEQVTEWKDTSRENVLAFFDLVSVLIW